MLIPLWLPWTVVAVLLVSALLQAPVAGDGPREREVRTTVLLRAWGMVAVVAVVAAVVTWDRVQVSEDELYEATQEAVALTQGGVRFDHEQVEVLLGDRLGRGVSVMPVEQSGDEAPLYDVQVRSGTGEAYDGAQACIEVLGSEEWDADVDEGGCDEQ